LQKTAWGLGSLIEPRADITIVVRKRDLSPRSGIDQFVLQGALKIGLSLSEDRAARIGFLKWAGR
jgi:hypothetical protein